jgi:hypothetical protein
MEINLDPVQLGKFYPQNRQIYGTLVYTHCFGSASFYADPDTTFPFHADPDPDLASSPTQVGRQEFFVD